MLFSISIPTGAARPTARGRGDGPLIAAFLAGCLVVSSLEGPAAFVSLGRSIDGLYAGAPAGDSNLVPQPLTVAAAGIELRRTASRELALASADPTERP